MASEEDVSGLKTVYLFRTGVQFSAQQTKESAPAMGERGILVVGGVSLQTIERRGGGGGGYVVLPKGLYRCEMEQTDKIGRGFRIEAAGEYGHKCYHKNGNAVAFMIHAANYPYEITGCIAPGKAILENGVGQSDAAMQEIFTFCGGWGVGKKMMLDVDSF